MIKITAIDLKKTRLVKAAAWLAHALVFPVGIAFRPLTFSLDFKKIGTFLLAWKLLLPASALFFPSAKEVLRQEGIDGAVVGELAEGKKVYIADGSSFAAKLHLYFQGTPLFAPYVWYASNKYQNNTIMATPIIMPPRKWRKFSTNPLL